MHMCFAPWSELSASFTKHVLLLDFLQDICVLIQSLTVYQVDADCLENDKIAREACKQLASKLGAKEVEEKQAFRSLEGTQTKSQDDACI